MVERQGLTVSESTPVFPPVRRPPAGAPNVVVIVLDDLGFAQLGCFGSDIATPAHRPRSPPAACATTASTSPSLCSPTRACLLTGRNHHAVGMGFLADIPMAFPGYTGRIPPSAATLPRLLRDAGYNTIAVGKWHLAARGGSARPRARSTAGRSASASSATTASCRATPTTGRRTSCATTTTSSRRARPEDGYHLTEDLADEAIRYVARPAAGRAGQAVLPLLRASAPCTRRTTSRRSGSSRTEGRFDDGWERWRERGVRAAARGRASCPRAPC